MTIKPRDGAEGWVPNIPPPSTFDQAAYQKRIDDLVGTRDGRSIIKLAWAPQEFRWWPHPCGAEPPGYVFPIFHAYTDLEGKLIAAPRWVLLMRLETEQYAPTEQFWESKRYAYDNGVLWDMTGPIPNEKYVELRCHSYHDGICCACLGESCHCGQQYEHCWGWYAEPNERLLDWIRKTAWEARHDPDVNPTADVRFFEATQTQNDLRGAIIDRQQKNKEEKMRFSQHMLSHWERKPHSTTSLIQST